jgi:type IV pilus assembly protein PilA
MQHDASSSAEPSILLPVLAFVGMVFWPVGVILSIVAFVKVRGAKGTTARRVAVIALVMNALVSAGLFAAIFVPSYVSYQCRSRQSEAKGNLKALHVAEESHRAETDAYDADVATIGFTPRGQTIRYTYTILEATKDTFRAEARGIGDMAGDHWAIDHTNQLVNVSNICQ